MTDPAAPLLTPALLHTLFPHVSATHFTRLLPPLLAAMAEFRIITPVRLAMFLAQAGYESSAFQVREENLTYTTAKRLREVWPEIFRTTDPAPYVRNPQRLANLVYANNDLGNGPMSSGDGWRYRGRGYLQVTGRDNYTSLVAPLGHDVVHDPDYLTTLVGAARSACCWWYRHHLNDFADQRDLRGCTRVLAGKSYLGLKERTALWEQAQTLLKVPRAIADV